MSTYAFSPDYAVAPGETLRDRLRQIGLSQSELSMRAGLSTKHVNQIMRGIAPITLETAISLERITGVPANVWNRRESDYRESLMRANPPALSTEDEAWLASLPIRELQKRDQLPVVKDRRRLFEAVLAFFGVADRAAYERVWRQPVASFRRSAAYASAPGSALSWLRIAQLEAQPARVEPYSAPQFRLVLQQIRSLTAGGDANLLIELCASAGVVVVFVPEVTGCRMSGAAWWAAPGRAVIALSDRWKKDDHFWFSFFHEAGHILLHSKKETFIDDGADDDLLEDEANTFARDLLIPPSRLAELRQLSTETNVVEFAAELGIAAGIIVGRLQHDGWWDWSRGNKLKRPLHIVD